MWTFFWCPWSTLKWSTALRSEFFDQNGEKFKHCSQSKEPASNDKSNHSSYRDGHDGEPGKQSNPPQEAPKIMSPNTLVQHTRHFQHTRWGVEFFVRRKKNSITLQGKDQSHRNHNQWIALNVNFLLVPLVNTQMVHSAGEWIIRRNGQKIHNSSRKGPITPKRQSMDSSQCELSSGAPGQHSNGPQRWGVNSSTERSKNS